MFFLHETAFLPRLSRLLLSLLPCRAHQAPSPPSSCAHPSAQVGTLQLPLVVQLPLVQVAVVMGVATLVGWWVGATL